MTNTWVCQRWWEQTVATNRSDCFRHLIDRVVSRINGWKEKLLSLGGKEILIKSIAQVVPVLCDDGFQNS
jgi:hypothetical protein